MVEVVYAVSGRYWSLETEYQQGLTPTKLVEWARCREPFCWIDDFTVVGYAVWGKEVSADHLVQDGDRIELLRPLVTDPMDARRARASKI